MYTIQNKSIKYHNFFTIEKNSKSLNSKIFNFLNKSVLVFNNISTKVKEISIYLDVRKIFEFFELSKITYLKRVSCNM